MKTLIVVDMQNDFISGVLGSEKAKAIVKPVADYIQMRRANGWKIIATRDEHDTSYAETKEGKAIPEHCLKWEEGFFFDPKIKGVIDPEEDYVICKPTFGSIELINILYSLDDEEVIDEIEICGLCTDICVIANAVLVASAFENAKITILKDLCAGTTEEAENAAFTIAKQLLINVENARCASCCSVDDCKCKGSDNENCDNYQE